MRWAETEEGEKSKLKRAFVWRVGDVVDTIPPVRDNSVGESS
jgi:hypothetical protein